VIEDEARPLRDSNWKDVFHAQRWNPPNLVMHTIFRHPAHTWYLFPCRSIISPLRKRSSSAGVHVPS
jgi:hypothetical protein